MKDLYFENSKDTLNERFQELKEVFEDESISVVKRKVRLRHKLQTMSDTKWTVVEEILLEIEIDNRTKLATDQIDSLPPVHERITRLEQEIRLRFADNPELAEILVHSIPGENRVRDWLKRPDWKEEIDRRMRDDTLFSYENRHKMIQAVFAQGLKGNAKFAEMYLKMSGDIGKTQEKDPVESTFEKITKSLNKKQ